MTLDELLKELKKLRQGDAKAGKLKVWQEGCDCSGETSGVVIRNGGVVLLRGDVDG